MSLTPKKQSPAINLVGYICLIAGVLCTIASIVFPATPNEWVLAGAVLTIFGIILTYVAQKRLAAASDERIVSADARAAEAREKADALEADAAQARQTLRQLTDSTQDRTLSPGASQALLEGLRGHDISAMIIYGSDREPFAYGEQIKAALEAAGVKLASMSGGTVRVGAGVVGGRGVQISGEPSKERTLLADAFSAAGIPHEVTERPPFDGALQFGLPVPKIYIGERPPVS